MSLTNQTILSNASLASGVYDAIPMPSGVPSSVDFAPLFTDNTTLYFYNPADTTSDTIWTYNVSTTTWKSIPVSNAGSNPSAALTGGWVSAPGTGKSYYTGTSDSALARRDTVPNPGLQIFDSTSSTPKWTSNIQGGMLLSSGELVYVRSGREGVLLAFGGVDPNEHTQFASSTLGDYRDMSQIGVYDIASSTWHNVNATGNVPVGRINFCAGVSSAPDDTSFQVVIYGGYNLRFARPANDIYVLSVPSFQWIKVSPQGNDAFGRWGHSCVVWEDAQMLVLGGLIENSLTGGGVANQAGCNSSHPPFLVLDTTSFTWQSSFKPQRSYSVPQAVYQVIGGDYRGLSSMKGPTGGWNNSDLEAIFATTVPKISQPTSFPPVAASATGNPTAGVSVPTNSATPQQGGGGLSTTAIAGLAGGIGGLVVVMIAAVIIFLVVRRRRRKTAPMAIDPLEPSSDKAMDSLNQGAGGEGKLTGMHEKYSNAIHEADPRYALNEMEGNNRVAYEADGQRVIELSAGDPMEAGGRELSKSEADDYLYRGRGASAGRGH